MAATHTPLDQAAQFSDAVLHEYDVRFTRGNVTVLSGENLADFAILGKVTASGKYVEYNPAGADGSEVAAGMLVAAVDASAADVVGAAILRGPAIFRRDGVVWPTGITDPQIATAIGQLEAIDIIVRDEIPNA